MRLHALLSWFDEPEDLLVLCLDGLTKAGVSSVVAVDGRYAMFPADDDVSPVRQRAIIDGACRHHAMTSSILTPNAPWESESAKRTALFSLALSVSTRDDWWWVVDADEVVMESPSDLLERLAEAEEDTARALLVDTVARAAKRPDWPFESWLRCLFRAQPMTVGRHHYDYLNAQTGKQLWAGASDNGLDPPLHLDRDLVIEHRPRRDVARVLLKDQYYSRRDATGAEMDDCLRCPSQATRRVYAGLRMVNGIPQGRIEEVCDVCAADLERISRRWLLQHNLDPDKVRFNERYAEAEA